VPVGWSRLIVVVIAVICLVVAGFPAVLVPAADQLITAIIASEPPRPWSGHELALRLHVKPRNVLTQLGEWAKLGFFTRTSFGTYALNTPSSPASSTTAPDP
jgi:hypothetical protein